MPKLSIVNLISFLFAVTMLVINVTFFAEHKRTLEELEYSVFQRFMLGMHIRAEGGEHIVESLKEINLKYADESNDEIRKGGVKLLQDTYCDMVEYKEKLYYVPRDINSSHRSILNLMFKAGIETDDYGEILPANTFAALENTKELSMARFWTVAGTINAVTIGFFIVLMKKLLGLRNLKKQIRAVGAGSRKSIDVGGRDELGEIAQEFNLTMQKINNIKEARELFLRNILHELRTPVMKGKIISGIVKDEEFKDDLKQIFTRQELVLSEIVKLEKFSSDEWRLNKNEYRLIDVADHAMDLLFAQNKERVKVDTAGRTPILSVDFELFATAIKNLLDNALKYSKDAVLLQVRQDRFVVASSGERIEEERLNFTKAFNRKTQLANSGLGLGLYIANQIFVRHGCEMRYEYSDGKNRFLVYFGNAWRG